MGDVMPAGELRGHLAGLQAASWANARLAQAQVESLRESLHELREQTGVMRAQLDEHRYHSSLLEVGLALEAERFASELDRAEREDEFRRIMWKEQTEAGRRYARVERIAGRVSRWVESVVEEIRTSALVMASDDGLLDEVYEPAQLQQYLEVVEPAEPDDTPVRLARKSGIISGGFLGFFGSMVVWIPYVLQSDPDSGYIGFVGTIESVPLAWFLGMLPVIVATALAMFYGSRRAPRKARARLEQEIEARRTEIDRRMALAAWASRWLERHELRIEKYGLDPLLEDPARRSAKVTAMGGHYSNPVEVRDVLVGILDADHHDITMDRIDAWEHFLSSITVENPDGTVEPLLEPSSGDGS